MPRTVFTPVDLNLSQAVLAQAILDDLRRRHTLGCNQAFAWMVGPSAGSLLTARGICGFYSQN